MTEDLFASEYPTRDLWRVVVCGAVDDGKSTLLGRLLVATGSIPLDEVAAAQRMSRTSGSEAPVGTIDYSLIADGLEAERAQGITIDVAHRHLRLPSGRRVILADSPGHEQYTRNMAVAASEADIAVLVVDASRGIRDQTLRHATVCSLMGVRRFIVAVNKLDAVSNPERSFSAIRDQLTERFALLAARHDDTLAPAGIDYLALSGLRGDNVTAVSDLLPRGDQPTLLAAIEAAVVQLKARDARSDPGALRLPIQTVIRTGSSRLLAGRIARGVLSVGSEVSVWPAGTRASVVAITMPDSASTVGPGASVTIELDRDVDAGRGDILVSPHEDDLPESRAHLVTLVWLDAEPLDASASYLLRVGPLEVPARIEAVRFTLDLDSGAQQRGRPLKANDIGVVEVSCDRPILIDPFAASRDTGGFVLVDRITSRTVAAGMSLHPLRRESDVTRHSFTVDRGARERLNGVRSGVVWLTGLPGSGKSTIADLLERQLFERGVRCYVLDGDAVRQTLSEDLGFSPADRAENVRRVARTAQLMMDAGLIVIVSLVSPFKADRSLAREMFAGDDFLEVFVDTPLAICVERDPKGLYARARLTNDDSMTGLGQTYESPRAPDLRLDGTQPAGDSADALLKLVFGRRLA
jgi:bifunctional enzyme CysN/CysC